MVKQQGSLGFTLRKEDESVLGHYVRALVREPALSDGRIRPGDKIVAVNDVPLSPMTHEEAVIFLRQAADVVKLRLYRDTVSSPIAAVSPTHSQHRTLSKSRVRLRPEAINLLSDLAYNRKQTPATESSTASSMRSTATSPRRLRRGTKNSSQSDLDTTDSKSKAHFMFSVYVGSYVGTYVDLCVGSGNLQYLVTSQPSSICSDSEKSLDSQCSYVVQSNHPLDPNEPINATYIVEDVAGKGEFYDEEELYRMVDSEYGGRPDRPNFLDLVANSECPPVASRKPRFQFTVAANAYELNKLDNDALDAPIYTLTNTGENTPFHAAQDGQDFQSLPCEIFLVACKTESDLKKVDSTDDSKFCHKNPVYQSAHVATANDATDSPQLPNHPKEVIKKEGKYISIVRNRFANKKKNSRKEILSESWLPVFFELLTNITVIAQEREPRAY